MEFTLLTDRPVPIWTAPVDSKTYQYQPPLDHFDLTRSFDVLKRYVEFRAVEIDRLPTILTTGVDVEPTTAPIFVGNFNKAWEYGEWPKVVMAFDGMKLERTFREIVISDATADEITQLMVDYPTPIKDATGERLRLTRLAATDPRAASPYESEYCRWIPGNPFDALLAVFVFTAKDDNTQNNGRSGVESGGTVSLA